MHAAPEPPHKLIDSIKIRALRLPVVCVAVVCPRIFERPNLLALAINFHCSRSQRTSSNSHSHSDAKLMAAFGSCTAGSWVILFRSICQFVTRSAVFFFIFSFLHFLRLIRLAQHQSVAAAAATLPASPENWRHENGGAFAEHQLGATVMATLRYEFKINIKWKSYIPPVQPVPRSTTVARSFSKPTKLVNSMRKPHLIYVTVLCDVAAIENELKSLRDAKELPCDSDHRVVPGIRSPLLWNIQWSVSRAHAAAPLTLPKMAVTPLTAAITEMTNLTPVT